jgi:D-alanine-D-alanine ligase
MQKIRVGVLRGGISSEYDVSLNTGQSVLFHLDQDKYAPKDILITKDGTWHLNGFPITLAKLAREVDVIFNALHGAYGEDGKVQQELERFNIPYTGSRIMPSAIAMNKGMSKQCFESVGLKTPKGVILKPGDNIEQILLPFFREVSGMHVVKPLNGGSSLGIVLSKSFGETLEAVKNILDEGNAVIVEEFIKGREITCGVIEGFEGQTVYPLFPIEILSEPTEEIWGYDAKYNGKTTEVCPANLEEDRMQEIQRMAVAAHNSIGLRHYSRSDFIVSPRGIYILEINNLPGLTEHSLVPKALKAAGMEFPEFLDYLLSLAIHKR